MSEPADGAVRLFDLNIEQVLEHWPVSFAVRELIANALDEQLLAGTTEPTITNDPQGRWHIRDFGRGLHYEHLTQNENEEKRCHPAVIGQFGMGLKDALAVFHRRGVQVEIRSRHGDVSTAMRAKRGFGTLQTLHAIIRPATNPSLVGTDVVLQGVSDDDIAAALRFFLRYSDDRLLETTRYGQVLARADASSPARIYVKGLLVATEDNFLFSYNITDINKPLRQALNRERSNVGRTAYTDRVKSILKTCRSAEVARPLAADLAGFATGQMHDELTWKDVTLHACQTLATHEKVVFVTPWQLEEGSPQLQYAKEEGFRLVTVPSDVADKLGQLTDLDGQPLLDLHAYRQAWNDSFTFSFVHPNELTDAEQAVHNLTPAILHIAQIDTQRVGIREILISETMRLNDHGRAVLGAWEEHLGRIVIRRDQLCDPAHYCGTLIHELTHALSGQPDQSLAFEDALTRTLGIITAGILSSPPPPPTVPTQPPQPKRSRWTTTFRRA